MTPITFIVYVIRDLFLRLFPHKTQTGLRRIGTPGPNSPVLLTCNYALTVRRLERALRGHDLWLLVANSRGINVWCAAGGGHFTHHDVISVLRTSGIEELVTKHEVILPQLGATGIERRAITQATGWKTKWGPARLEDIPAYLADHERPHKAARWMRFPWWERIEMALMWAFWIAPITTLICGWLTSWTVGLVTGGVSLVSIITVFLLLPHLRVWGDGRILTYVAIWLLSAAACAGLLFALQVATVYHLSLAVGALAIGTIVLSVDLCGATPWYPSTINTRKEQAMIELLEDRCTGAADCIQVCPRDVLKMDGKRRKVEIIKPDDCIQCAACIVQCPEDALRFRYNNGRVVEPETIRRTRMNMLGERSIELPSPQEKISHPD